MEDSPKARWKITIECRTCGAQAEMTNPSFSVDRVHSKNLRGPGRMVLIGVPEVCPQCHNLRKVR